MNPRSALLALPFAVALASTPSAAAPATSAKVIVYRCTDAAGRLSLRDSPCRRGEKQETRAMLRPTDPPPRREVATSPRRGTPAIDAPPMSMTPRVIYVTPPRPTYECTTPDGARYASDSPEGNPRWVPLWTLGYPVAIAPGVVGGYGGSAEYRGGDTRLRIEGGRRWRTPPGTVLGPSTAYAPAGAWIRDTCHALPPAEVCARLSDQRERLDRRYFSALQGDRDAIVREQRGIDARLATECRG